MATSVVPYNADRRMLTETPVASGHPTYRSETRVDIALLASALVLQRFGLPFFHTSLPIGFVFAALILIHQFACGRLFIRPDRFLWFLVVALAATSSLLLNFENRMLTSYGLFMLTYFLFTLGRPSTPYQYKSTLQGFQSLLLLLSCLAIAQFVAQFVVDGVKLIMFYGIFPDFILPPPMGFGRSGTYAVNTIIPIPGSSLIKSNGIFLAEPSAMSQMAALGILIEVLEFRRPRYLIVLTLGLLLAYSGTGITILLLCLPLAGLVNRRAQLPAIIVSLIAFGLLATGIIHLNAFTSRIGEFENTQASGFIRFVSPFWLAADYFGTVSLPEFLFGNGPGGSFTARVLYYSAGTSVWLKLIYEYGLITAFVFICFLGSCFRDTRCPGTLIATFIYMYVGIGNLLDTSLLTLMVVLCTLNGPEHRRRRFNKTDQYRSSFVAGSVAG